MANDFVQWLKSEGTMNELVLWLDGSRLSFPGCFSPSETMLDAVNCTVEPERLRTELARRVAALVGACPGAYLGPYAGHTVHNLLRVVAALREHSDIFAAPMRQLYERREQLSKEWTEGENGRLFNWLVTRANQPP